MAELRRPSGVEIPIAESGPGLGHLPRLGLAFKDTTQDKAAFLRELGYDVRSSLNGQLFVRNMDSGSYEPVDENRFTPRDITDNAGEIVSAIPSLFAGPNVPAQTGAAVVGEAVRQGIGEMLPGKSEQGVDERVMKLGISGLIGGVGQGIPNATAAAGRFIGEIPQRIARQAYRSKANTPEAEIGAKIVEKTGVQLTPGQRVGSGLLQSMEGYLRRDPITQDAFAIRDAENLSKSLAYLNNTLDTVAGKARTPGAIGDGIISSHKHALDQAINFRSAAGRQNFNAAYEATGRGQIIDATPLLNEIDSLIADYNVKGVGDAGEAVVGKLRTLRKQVVGTGDDAETPMIDANTLQRLLSHYSKGAAGRADVLDISNAQEKRFLAGRLLGALETTLDDAVDAGIDGTGQLKYARDQWREMSEGIEGLRKSTIGRALGMGDKDVVPERLVERTRTMRPTELKKFLDDVGNLDPSLVPEIKRNFFEDALVKAGMFRSEAAAEAFGAIGEEGAEVSAKRLLSELKKSPVWDALDSGQRNGLRLSLQTIDRVSQKGGMEGSPTHFAGVVGAMMQGVTTQALQVLSSVAGKKAMANALLDPQFQKSVFNLNSPSTSAEGRKRAAERVFGILGISAGQIARGGVMEDETPLNETVQQPGGRQTFDGMLKGLDAIGSDEDLLRGIDEIN